MDERQGQIVEGAGLQESRLNTEFIDWLKKWGDKLLYVVFILAVAWAGYRWLEQRQKRVRDEAFIQHEAAQASDSPDNLVRVANEHKGRGAVYELSMLRAADIYLLSANRGVRPNGDPGNIDDLISDEERFDLLDQAEKLYTEVLERVEGEDWAFIHEMAARNGLAAVALSRMEWQDGREVLEQAQEFARSNGLDEMASWQSERLNALDNVMNEPPLLAEEELAAAYRDVPEEELPAFREQYLDELLGEQRREAELRERGAEEPTFGPVAPDPDEAEEEDPDDG